MNSLVAFVGFRSCGKDTAAEHLIEHNNFQPFAFADSIKDCLASIFVWDRAMLAGDTIESRIWRETIDPWWADQLEIPEFSPRWAMTHFGTDLMRKHFDDRIWILNTDRRLTLSPSERNVIKDGRFPNELDAVRKRKGSIIRIRRGADPWWFDVARKANEGCMDSRDTMASLDVHESEWAWIGQQFDAVIDNNGTIAELHSVVRDTVGALHG